MVAGFILGVRVGMTLGHRSAFKALEAKRAAERKRAKKRASTDEDE